LCVTGVQTCALPIYGQVASIRILLLLKNEEQEQTI
jgi:hypothetical protein